MKQLTKEEIQKLAKLLADEIRNDSRVRKALRDRRADSFWDADLSHQLVKPGESQKEAATRIVKAISEKVDTIDSEPILTVPEKLAILRDQAGTLQNKFQSAIQANIAAFSDSDLAGITDTLKNISFELVQMAQDAKRKEFKMKTSSSEIPQAVPEPLWSVEARKRKRGKSA